VKTTANLAQEEPCPAEHAWWGATTHSKYRSHHGKENHWFYQAASASW
jgi:hypothetical protein